MVWSGEPGSLEEEEEGEEWAGLIFCNEDERDGGLGRVGGGVETKVERGER